MKASQPLTSVAWSAASPPDLSLSALAAQAESYLAQLANGLAAEVHWRREVQQAEEALEVMEARCVLSPEVQEHKNEAARKAAATVRFAEDAAADGVRATWRIAEYELLTCQAQIQVIEERLRMERSILAALAVLPLSPPAPGSEAVSV